ncbi:TIM-barrel domain-containing protein [Paraconexibacter algicola]|uniref:Glycoside hydrolase family 31 N-terminal domain-containing protein n=1 Tax=Paraconexibacter algicola TaxID=2133960 RepID=A0A2T4UMH7_9ACTN|nr:TIM-barrel domain-containing protein [Paraconexibacter algicola]PTL60440.1 hypothetical protein C7Y72_12715 [Paraconexibacter algicola]
MLRGTWRGGPARWACCGALSLGLLGAGPQTALAAPVIDDDRIAVTGLGPRPATLVVDRAPLRLTVREADGTVLLRSTAADGRGPTPVLALADPQPLGSNPLLPTATRYAPLVVTLGARLRTEWPAGPWEANTLTGTLAGTRVAATRVVAARAEGDGAALELATDDPGGTTVELRLLPAADGAVRMRVRALGRAVPVAAVAASFASPDRDERFRGFGGRHNALDQRGQALLGWIQQQNLGAGPLGPGVAAVPGTGGDRYLFPNGPTAAYSVSPSFLSSRGYGFLLERDELSNWRMASDRPDAWQVEVDGSALDARVVPGDAPRAIAALTTVTGRQRVPPRWAVEPMLDRSTVAFTGNAAQYLRSVRDDLRRLAELDIPIGAYRIEGAAQLAPQDLRELVAELRRRGIRPIVYFRPFVSQDGAGTEQPEVYDEAIRRGLVVRNGLGQPYLFPGNFLGVSALLDFTNPETVRWWTARIHAALDAGAQGFMQDFGEQVLSDMVFHDGRRGDVLHNRYPELFHGVTRRALDSWERANPDRGPVWFFTRAGYLGLDGSARHEHGSFAGDGNTDFSRSSGLASQAPDMLNRGIAGQYGFTTDIGGYFDFVTPETTKELLLRWAQWAVFSPYFRLHGSINSGTHVPWNYDEETVARYRDLSRLRVRAAPLLHEQFRRAARTGRPVAAPLWLAAPDAPGAATADQEWMVGPDLLVAPVVTEGATTRQVPVPSGCWEHGETGERLDGPALRTVDAPLGRLPWFVRCGTAPLEAAAARERAGCRDRRAPASRITTVRLARGRVAVRGTATDPGCARRRGVRRVAVAVALETAGRCRFLTAAGRLERPRDCRRIAYLPATGTARFALDRRVRSLPAGRYRVWARATDRSGNVERTGVGDARRARLRSSAQALR